MHVLFFSVVLSGVQEVWKHAYAVFFK